ncbi:MAG: hypothetical protein QM817_38875 [Archangium sp.]
MTTKRAVMWVVGVFAALGLLSLAAPMLDSILPKPTMLFSEADLLRVGDAVNEKHHVACTPGYRQFTRNGKTTLTFSLNCDAAKEARLSGDARSSFARQLARTAMDAAPADAGITQFCVVAMNAVDLGVVRGATVQDDCFEPAGLVGVDAGP